MWGMEGLNVGHGRVKVTDVSPWFYFPLSPYHTVSYSDGESSRESVSCVPALT